MNKLTYVAFFVIIIIGICQAQSKGGHWQFENNGFDTADWDLADNNGILIDSASYKQDTPLQQGTSYLWLDSTYNNNFLKIEDSDDLDFMDENIGISAWIYPIKLDGVHFFITKGIQNVNPKTTNYSLRISKQKKLEFLIRDSGNQAQSVASSFTIPINQWIFVAAYYDFTAQKVYMWSDPLADAVDTLDFAQSFFENDGPLTIGAWYVNDDGADHPFKGRIDDVRISGRLEDIISTDPVSVRYLNVNAIGTFQLHQNYPNPFNPSTKISFYLPQADFVSLRIYDNQGKLVKTILEQNLLAGNHALNWDGKENASGVYYYQIASAHFSQTKKMILLK